MKEPDEGWDIWKQAAIGFIIGTVLWAILYQFLK